MADDIATLGFNVDTKGLNKGEKSLNKYAATGDNVERRTKGNAKGISSSFGMIAGAIGSVTAAYSSMSKIIGVSREFDILNSQLITATGSAQNAATAFEAINKFASTTPYDVAQATTAFTQLVNLGLTPSEAALRSYGNTAAAMGKDLSQLVEAVADASTGEFERLKEFGIKAKSEGDNVSLTFRGVTKTIKKEADSIEGYLMALGKNEFGGAMAVRAQTLDGALSNFGDTWDSLFLTISQQGVGSLIADSVRLATGAIQSLDDLISSGSLSNSFSALAGKFDGLIDDVASGFNIISAIIGESTNGWSKSTDTFFDNMMDGFKVLPEMTRFFIQAAAVNIGKFVDYAKIYGDAFVDVLGLRFDGLVEQAKLDGRLIANAMNPFSDDIDYEGELAAMTSKFASAEAEILANAERRANAVSNVADKLITSYALESVAATDSYEKRITLSEKMLAQYKKEKAAKKGDVLEQFKVVPDATKDAESLIESLKKTIEKEDIFGGVTDSINEALSAVQKLSKEGSKDYKHLGKAIEAVTLAQQFQATQEKINAAFEASASAAKITASGAEAQAAAAASASMAASLAAATAGLSLVASAVSLLGSLGGEIETTFAANQASQGLNVWGDKSESIANSIDITADATDKLVGINTGMLRALQSLQAGISGAAGLSARGVAATDFNFQANVSGGLLGGKSKVTDQGIEILGGIMSELIDDTMVMAYQEVKSKKHVWSSSKTNVETQLIDDASDQFALVFDSLADTVFEAGSALGMNSAQLEKSINEFEIATTKISLKGLGIEEQQAEIEAVFSKIFDDLAADVIPFASDFQHAGEGIGETLTRLATEVSIAEFAAKNLGIELGDKLASPELFTQISDNLTNLTGGIESFAEKTASFVDDFAPETVKFTMNSDAITEQLAAVNLAVPESADAFYHLMTTLDGTTAAGQAQIAALLNVQDTAGDYYDLLEDRQDKAASKLADEVAAQDKAQSELDSFNNSLLSLSDNLRGAIVGIYGTEVATSKLSLTAALESARLGDFSKALDLNLSNLSPSMEGFESPEAFNIEQAIMANKLAELADLTAGQATTDDMMLTNSNDQVMLLTSINDNISSAYVPQQTQVQNNDNIIVELRAVREELSYMKNANKETAENTKESADSLQRIEIGGLEVRA